MRIQSGRSCRLRAYRATDWPRTHELRRVPTTRTQTLAWRGCCSSEFRSKPPMRYVSAVENGKEIPTGLRRILVPVDFSDASSAALDYAINLAESHHASVDVLHVWDLPPPTRRWRNTGPKARRATTPSRSQDPRARPRHRAPRAVIRRAQRPGVDVVGVIESGDPVGDPAPGRAVRLARSRRPRRLLHQRALLRQRGRPGRRRGGVPGGLGPTRRRRGRDQTPLLTRCSRRRADAPTRRLRIS